ncbi:MAG: VCBS repeat-containing protein [Hydrogenophaga sp.]|nr:VCBS repeat-containing protein [Hydrogenophaga sp.]
MRGSFGLALGLLPAWALSMGLSVDPADATCAPTSTPPTAPLEASTRLPDSQAVAGSKDIAWVWLGSPTRRYPHGALGSPVHAGSVHVLARTPRGPMVAVSLSLPVHRVFEDRVPRLVDLDGDGRDEIVLVEADALRGAALVVLGLAQRDAQTTLVERARGPHAGSTFRWLNPVGFADFDGDGQLDVASVTTPHIGGVLTLHRWQPPALVPFARALDVSNHRMGALEQQLAVIVQQPGFRPTIVVPDMARQSLHALRWEAPGQWHELADLQPLPGTVERLTPRPDGACAWLADGRVLRITLRP